MFDKYDFARVVDYPDRESRDLERLIGQEGMIIGVDRNYDYPYEVCFFNREAQELSMWYGIILFADYHLEKLDQNIEGAKKELEKLRIKIYNKKIDRYRLWDNIRRIERML